MNSSEVKEKIQQLSYMKAFKCIGSKCEDNCCIGWDVDIDKKTYDDYMNMKASPLTERFEKDLIVNKDSYDSEIDYGRVVLKAGKRCPFLGEDALCDIQRTHGEKALSKVCNAYPRIINKVDGVYELSATLSCPEVARLVLLNTSSFTVEELMTDTSRFIITQQVNTLDPSIKKHPAKFFNELRGFSIKVVQNKKYTFIERLQLLGEVHNRLLPLHSGGDLNAIPSLLKKATKRIEKGEYKAYLSKCKGDYREQVKFFNKHTGVLDNDNQIQNQRFGDFLYKAKSALEIKNSKLSKNTYKLYEDHAKNLVEPFMKSKEQIFENYLVNNMYKAMYPFSEAGDPYAGYTMLIVRLFFIKAVLVGLSVSGLELTSKLLVEVIQSYAKTLEHHKTFMDELLQYLMETGEDDLGNLMKLL